MRTASCGSQRPDQSDIDPADPAVPIRLMQIFFGPLRTTRYEARALELLDDAECTVVASERGLMIHGPVAGARDVIKLHLLLGDDTSLLAQLPNARLTIAEV